MVKRGTVLWRLHRANFDACQFNPTAASDPLKGGRFDSSDGSYAYLYAARTKEVAIAEVFIRDLPADGPARILPRIQLKDRLISAIQIKADLQLVKLHGPSLGQVGQDSWLTKCDSSEYGLTRRWAISIRAWMPAIAGFVWRSKRDENSYAYVFFSDRLPTPTIFRKYGRSVKLDGRTGLSLMNRVLAKHNVALSP